MKKPLNTLFNIRRVFEPVYVITLHSFLATHVLNVNNSFGKLILPHAQPAFWLDNLHRVFFDVTVVTRLKNLPKQVARTPTANRSAPPLPSPPSSSVTVLRSFAQLPSSPTIASLSHSSIIQPNHSLSRN